MSPFKGWMMARFSMVRFRRSFLPFAVIPFLAVIGCGDDGLEEKQRVEARLLEENQRKTQRLDEAVRALEVMNSELSQEEVRYSAMKQKSSMIEMEKSTLQTQIKEKSQAASRVEKVYGDGWGLEKSERIDSGVYDRVFSE